MIIVKDSRNCLFNAARPVTDTAWLKLHEKDSRHSRHAKKRHYSRSPCLSLGFYSTFMGCTHRFRSDGGHKTEANGQGLADKSKGEGRKERGRERGRDLTFNLQRRQTSERVIFQPAAVTDVKRVRKRVIKGGTELFDYQILVNCEM